MKTVFRAGAFNCTRLFGRKRQVRRPFGVQATILALCVAPSLLFLGLTPALIDQARAGNQFAVFHHFSDRPALAIGAQASKQVRSRVMAKNRWLGEIKLAANVAGDRQVNPANMEKFNHGLDELNRRMPPRSRGIDWDVTELIRPFLPNCVTVANAIVAFKGLGFSPHQDKVGKRYYIYIRVEYDRLSAQGRTHFFRGDWLVIGYDAGGAGDGAKVSNFSAALLNDGGL